MIINVEGNIGSGKSTLLKVVSRLWPESHVVEEWFPHEELKDMIADPERHAESFQYLMAAGRIKNIRDAHHMFANDFYKPVFVERSLEIDRVFAMTCFGHIKEKITRYMCVQEMFRRGMPKWDFTIYLQTNPKECMKRIAERGRAGEDGYTLEYVQKIHNGHEALFRNWGGPVMILSSIDIDWRTEAGALQAIDKIKEFMGKLFLLR